MQTSPIIVAITGATGIIYGVNILQELKKHLIDTILVMSTMAIVTAKEETEFSFKQITSLATKFYTNDNLAASIASGSFVTSGMIVAPCSIKTLSSIANSFNDNLITRSADVTLKERRKLVLLVRETPLHLGHIKLMATATENGAIIMPPVPAFYNKPSSINDIVNHTTSRVLDLFNINNTLINRWQ